MSYKQIIKTKMKCMFCFQMFVVGYQTFCPLKVSQMNPCHWLVRVNLRDHVTCHVCRFPAFQVTMSQNANESYRVQVSLMTTTQQHDGSSGGFNAKKGLVGKKDQIYGHTFLVIWQKGKQGSVDRDAETPCGHMLEYQQPEDTLEGAPPCYLWHGE